jgi:prepilin-type N-terminal cleavage/methylation domain-containing protein
MRRRAGFTLIELLTVVAVLTILLGLAGIPASGDGSAALDLAEVQLRDAFEYARTLSYSLGSPHGVAFDPLEHRYAVVAADGQPVPNPLTHTDWVVAYGQPGQLQGLHIAFVNFGNTAYAGIFDGAGVPVEGGLITLAKGTTTRTFALDPATGALSEL